MQWVFAMHPTALANHWPIRRPTAGSKQDGGAVADAVSAAVLLACIVGVLQSVALGLLGRHQLAAWGAPPSSVLHPGAAAYLQVRALAAPVTVLLLVLQGSFRWVCWDTGLAMCNAGQRACPCPPAEG